MPQRTAQARWQGALRDGKGTMRFGSGAFEGAYSFNSRMETGTGTNPEELIGAAQAGCFSMAFANELSQAGHVPQEISTSASVQFDKTPDGWRISRIDLETKGTVPGIDEAAFARIATHAKENCPVSNALTGTQITLHATLTSAAAAR